MDLVSTFIKGTWEVVLEPSLTRLGLYEAPDRCYGRGDIPFSSMEKRLHEDKEVDVSFGKVMLSNDKDWVWYQVWQDNTPQIKRKGDIIFAHGTGVHSGTVASHSKRYLKAGYRLIVPDLVSHGYSSGLHVYQKSMSAYTEGLHAVLMDVAQRDDSIEGVKKTKWNRLPTFMLGISFGATVALQYAIDYPLSFRGDRDQDQEEEEEGAHEVAIDGIIANSPILGYPPGSMSVPIAAVQILRFLHHWLHIGRLELVTPHKKALDSDPDAFKRLINADMRAHQGSCRIGHMVMMEEAVVGLHKVAHLIRHPIFFK